MSITITSQLLYQTSADLGAHVKLGRCVEPIYHLAIFRDDNGVLSADVWNPSLSHAYRRYYWIVVNNRYYIQCHVLSGTKASRTQFRVVASNYISAHNSEIPWDYYPPDCFPQD